MRECRITETQMDSILRGVGRRLVAEVVPGSGLTG